MLGPFATLSCRTPIHQMSLLTPPANRCPRRRQRVTEGTAMAPWNGPKTGSIHTNIIINAKTNKYQENHNQMILLTENIKL